LKIYVLVIIFLTKCSIKQNHKIFNKSVVGTVIGYV
jgi:hypothetical protein